MVEWLNLASTVIRSFSNFVWEYLLAIIAILLVIEVFAVIFAFPERLLDTVENQDAAKKRASELQGRALTLAGLAFAGFSLLITAEDDIGPLLDVFRLLALAVGLLFISYQAKEYTRSKEYWRIIQEKTLSYGFLTIFLATALTFSTVSGVFPLVLTISLLIAAIIRYRTVRDQIRMYKKMRSKDKSVNESRGSVILRYLNM